MKDNNIIKNILSNYESENLGSKHNLARILMHGKLGGTGKLVILPVDQGFEHGPIKSFSINSEAYDPSYHYKFAIESGVSAYSAPLGMLEAKISDYSSQLPLILKLNSNNVLNDSKNQAITAAVKDALRLGCVGIGITIYPGSPYFTEMIEKAKEIIQEAKSYGLAVIVWSYPRSDNSTSKEETAIDICSYACHIACLIGAHIVKVKIPTSYIATTDAKKLLKNTNIETLQSRVKQVIKSCFFGKRIILFSGGSMKNDKILLGEIQSIANAGANGSIIGRNIFQRPKANAMRLLEKIYDIYLNFHND